MGFTDIFKSAVDWLSSPALKGAANLATAGFDIYQGVNAMNQADKLSNAAISGMQASQATLDRLAGIQEPLMRQQAEYALKDLTAMRPLQEAQLTYGLAAGLSDVELARQIDPILRSSRKDLLTTLTEGKGKLTDRMRSQATTDVAAEFSGARSQEVRRMAGLGITPGSGLSQNYGRQSAEAEALARAAARTQASRTAEDTALARQSQALNLGMGIPLEPQQFTSGTSMGQIAGGLGSIASSQAKMAAGISADSERSFEAAHRGVSRAIDAWKTE